MRFGQLSPHPGGDPRDPGDLAGIGDPIPDEIEAALAKGPRRGPKPAEGTEAAEGGDEALVEDEAA